MLPTWSNPKKIALLAILISAAGCRFYFQKTTDAYTSAPHKGAVANGKNLAENVCAGCHYNESLKRYSGLPLSNLPRIGGRLFSANLTHSVTHGMIARYTDAELLYLIKTGISRSGRFMPYMMRPTMADADINDLIRYFRSDDPPLKAADTTAGATRINLIGKTGIRMTSKPSAYVKNVLRPDNKDRVAYGRYLVGIIGCYHCHSKSIGAISYTDPESTKGYLQGGMKMSDDKGGHVFASNITPDTATGIGRYSNESFARALREGIAIGNRKLHSPMPVFAQMTADQASAIYTYLRQVPAAHHTVRRK